MKRNARQEMLDLREFLMGESEVKLIDGRLYFGSGGAWTSIEERSGSSEIPFDDLTPQQRALFSSIFGADARNLVFQNCTMELTKKQQEKEFEFQGVAIPLPPARTEKQIRKIVKMIRYVDGKRAAEYWDRWARRNIKGEKRTKTLKRSWFGKFLGRSSPRNGQREQKEREL